LRGSPKGRTNKGGGPPADGGSRERGFSMKNAFRIIGIVALVAGIGLAAASCGGDRLSGMWGATHGGDTITLTFDNGTVVLTESGTWGTDREAGTYTIAGNYLTVTFNGDTSTGPFSISGNSLTIEMWGEELTFTRLR